MSNDQNTTINTDVIAQAISDEIKQRETSFRYPTTFFDALALRRDLATLADRAELLYRAARAEATIRVAKLPKDDPLNKNEETRKAAVDLETVHQKTLVTRSGVLAEQALFAVRHFLGETGSVESTTREAA